jgi:zinc transporter 1/2/3
VFLGAGLIHMLPDSFAGFAQILPGVDYPLPALLAALGVLLILFLEKVLMAGRELADEHTAAAPQGGVYAYALTVALSLHSILAGVALGTDASLVGSLVIFLAIIAHKGSAAFALGVGLHRGGFARGRILAIIYMFSLTTPIGVGIGLTFDWLLGGASGRLFEAVFDGLAAGTFLYIASLDILVEEFSDGQRLWPKFWLVLSGLGLMALLALFL